MTYFLVIVSVITSIAFLITIYNYFSTPILKKQKIISNQKPKISILIPARNEERTIKECLINVLNQNYKNTEILVLNDSSTDLTNEILANIKAQNLKILQGTELPADWNGKNWACWQLANQAKGEILLFIDADVNLEKETLDSALAIFQTKQIDLLSCYPIQKMETLGEKLIIPVLNWILLSFLPVKMVYTSPKISLTAANGQFMMFDRTAYFKINGHESVKKTVVEDIALACQIKKNNGKVMMILSDGLVKCRMYTSFKEAFLGFVKNTYLAVSVNPIIFIFGLFLLFLAFVSPFFLVFFDFWFVFALILILLNRIIISKISKQSIFMNILLHPIQIFLLLIIALQSLVKTFQNQLEWKGRVVNNNGGKKENRF